MTDIATITAEHAKVKARLATYTDVVGKNYFDNTPFDNIIDHNPDMELALIRLRNKYIRLCDQLLAYHQPEFYAAKREIEKKSKGNWSMQFVVDITE